MANYDTENKLLPIIWQTQFLGTNQRQDPDKIPDSTCPLILNGSFVKPGTVCKRYGSALTGTTQAGNGVYGLIDYSKPDGTHSLRAVRSTDLDTYDVGTNAWGAIDTGQFTASKDIQSTNYLSRVYHVGESDFLCYESGGACTDVSSGDNRVKATAVVSAQNTLFVCGIVATGATTVAWRDRVYYSAFDLTTFTGSDVLWNSDETGMADSTRWFSVGAPIIGAYTYGSPERMIVFTAEACFTFDITNDSNASGAQKLFNIGLAGPRAINVLNGSLVWADKTGRLYIWNGSGKPSSLSWDIEDDWSSRDIGSLTGSGMGQAIINLIDPDWIPSIAIGVDRNELFISIGDITYHGVTYSNCVIRGLINQAGDYILWSLDTYPIRPRIFANTYIDGQKVLCFGSGSVDDVYVMNLGVNDGTTAIPFKMVTKFMDFSVPFKTKEINNFFVKYRPQGTSETYLTLRFMVDGNWIPIDWSTPDAVSPVMDNGVIDMYTTDSSTNCDKVEQIQFPAGYKFRSVAVELSNEQVNERCEISGIGFRLSAQPLDINYE